jgi:hypothetical protein
MRKCPFFFFILICYCEIAVAQSPVQKFWALNQNKQFATPLDAIKSTGASMAYSVRKLRLAYTGPAMKVRKGTGTALATANVSFNAAGVVDTGSIITVDSAGTTSGYTVGATMSLKTFYGSASIFVRTWYDQSGNARHASQATLASQPRIVNAGTLDVSNAKASVYFNGSAMVLQATASAASVFDSGYIGTIAAVLEANNANATSFGYSAGTSRWLATINFSSNCYLDVGSSGYARIFGANGTSNGVLRNYMMIANAITTPRLEILVSGTSIGGTISGTPRPLAAGATTFAIGGVAGLSYHTGHQSELIVFPKALTPTERIIIDTGQSSFFSTP